MWERAGVLYKRVSVWSASFVAGSVKVVPNILRNRRVIVLREGVEGINNKRLVGGVGLCSLVSSLI